MFIRSERLFLRPAWPEDWDELLVRIVDEAGVKNLAKVPWPYTADAARKLAARDQNARLPHFCVTLPSSPEPARIIGSVGLGRKDGEVELGYWIERAHWGQGFATEAARAVLRLARALGHRRVTAGHFLDNAASSRVLRKIGFVPTGEVRPRYCLARGEAAPSVLHAIELGDASDCDGGNDDGAKIMRAA